MEKLRLSIQTGHNATVALMVDGKIVGVLSQEKIDNKKNSDSFPCGAINALIKECGFAAEQVDEVVMASTTLFPQFCNVQEVHHPTAESKSRKLVISGLDLIYRTVRDIVVKTRVGKVYHAHRLGRLKHKAMPELIKRLREVGIRDKPIHFVDHHTCHAYASFYSFTRNDKDDSLVFTLDGMGDGYCSCVWRVSSERKWEELGRTPTRSSIGSIYSETTRFLGMKVLEHEYKVMGLAAYNKGYYRESYKRLFKGLVYRDGDNSAIFQSRIDTSKFYLWLKKRAVGERFDNIAAAVQAFTEDTVTDWISAVIEETGIKNISTGGGVFMNVKLNKKVKEMKIIDRVHFMPSCGDESNPIGALYYRAVSSGEEVQPLGTLYLGIKSSNEEIRDLFIRQLDHSEYKVLEPDCISNEIARLLCEGEIVARHVGRCEWGARSLGNRAILANPSVMESFYYINDMIKARDFWMPFAPTILDTFADRYLEDYNPDHCIAEHMIAAYTATNQGRKDLKAALHQGDGTLRPQVLRREVNSDYYSLIEQFMKLTGIGGVLNTSFNLHGFPLVATPEQALLTFKNSGLKHLAIGPYLISKRK